MNAFPRGRIGYWWSEKKSRKLNVNEFASVSRASGFELIKINLDRPLEEQGPFTAIVHKLSDVLVKADKGDAQSKAVCEAFQNYADSHPDVVIIDPLPNVEKLLDRYNQYKLGEDSELRNEGYVFIPAFVELTTKNVTENVSKLKAAGVDFPIVCKPCVGHGSTLAHQMSLIFNEESLNDVNPPFVAQKFINHNAILYKLFIIGDEYFIIERPSLKNFYAGDQKTIYFDTHEISKPHSASALTKLDDNEVLTPNIYPEKEKMDHIVDVLRDCLGLNLFGIDVIIDNKSGHYAIIDMNVFPSYSEVDNFFQLLCNLILKKIPQKSSGIVEICKPVSENCSTATPLQLSRGSRKFNFENISTMSPNRQQSKAVIPYVPQCFCCPISDSCINKSNSEIEHFKCKTSTSENFLKTQNGHFAEINVKSSHLNAQDSLQDDSGIETSDSCDEKKKKSCYRTNKRQHSRSFVSACFDESG